VSDDGKIADAFNVHLAKISLTYSFVPLSSVLCTWLSVLGSLFFVLGSSILAEPLKFARQ